MFTAINLWELIVMQALCDCNKKFVATKSTEGWVRTEDGLYKLVDCIDVVMMNLREGDVNEVLSALKEAKFSEIYPEYNVASVTTTTTTSSQITSFQMYKNSPLSVRFFLYLKGDSKKMDKN